jgi:ketosteroid isomerase-like protein
MRFAPTAAMLALLAIPATGWAQEKAAWPMPVVSLPPELDRVLRDYEAAWQAGDGEGLAKVFTSDGIILPSGKLPERGTAAIRASHTEPGGDLELVAFAWATGDTVGYIVGGYRYPTTTGPGGKYVVALRKGRDGRWRIAADIENASRR